MNDNPLYDAIFRVSSVLEVPVVIAALLALVFLVVELGRFAVEVKVRRRRRPGAARAGQLAKAARTARDTAADPERMASAGAALAAVTWSARMDAAYAAVLAHREDENGVAKDLADFDLECQRRLARTRLLVRVGPALGLMGTLIPLAPALDGLARGDTKTLTDSLQVAFSITVLGLLIGAVAFGISLARENMYGQDYSDLEYVASILTEAAGPVVEPALAESAPAASTAAPIATTS